MSKEQFFPGVEFKLPSGQTNRDPEIVEVQDFMLKTGEMLVIEWPVVDLTKPRHEEEDELEEVIDGDEHGWKFDKVLREFSVITGLMEQELEISLPMNNRSVSFVERMKLIPEDPDDIMALVDKYGKYIIDGIAGDCTRFQDGSFAIRVGYKGQEDRIPKSEAMYVLAHEYGHSLGEHIEDPVFEEVKAYAFARLVMQYYFQSDYVGMESRTLQPDRVHDIAIHRIEQLNARRIGEAEIIAHLTARPFGRHQPSDYQNRLAA